MKQKTNRPMDEREKLRKFRELDDAFAQALRDLDAPQTEPEAAVAASGSDADVRGESSDPDTFERRLHALMQEYAQPREKVAHLLRTLQSLGRIA
ncbi:hypothetical protein [Halomonas sp. NO4]|uniref:hypothetical protein n=1 Tax=Halomonas sp. NO4 TaxID=2484813 RepID=UPI0013D5AD0C|nr:hypothetical protein [Halomonas sp. NO4]